MDSRDEYTFKAFLERLTKAQDEASRRQALRMGPTGQQEDPPYSGACGRGVLSEVRTTGGAGDDKARNGVGESTGDNLRYVFETTGEGE